MANILLKKPYTPVVFTSAVKSFNVYGISLNSIQAVYLSGYPYPNQTFFNPFSGVPKLSAKFPGFFGVKLLSSEYTSNNDNAITFTMPSAVRAGFVDIVVQNPAGYGTLRQYAVKSTYNPYVSGTSEHSSFVPYVRPWALGVKVLSAVTA